MSDLIEREAALCPKFTLPVGRFNLKTAKIMTETINRYSEYLAGLPSAQPELIRCKDCKYCEHWYRDKGRCFLWSETGIDVFEDGFCNYAKRRTEEGQDEE